MNIETRITELLAQAAPLRLLEDDDPAKGALAGIVDAINALRSMQSKGWIECDDVVKPRRGRPPKVEGDDAS